MCSRVWVFMLIIFVWYENTYNKDEIPEHINTFPSKLKPLQAQAGIT